MPHFIASHNYTCKQKVLTFSIVIQRQAFVFWIPYCVHYTSTKQIFHSLSLKEHISNGNQIFIKFYQPHHSKLLWRWFSLVANRRRHRTLRHACVYSLKYPTFFSVVLIFSAERLGKAQKLETHTLFVFRFSQITETISTKHKIIPRVYQFGPPKIIEKLHSAMRRDASGRVYRVCTIIAIVERSDVRVAICKIIAFNVN